jgi:hypothetical protein
VPALSTSTSSLSFPEITLGTYTGPETFTLQNTGASSDTINLLTGMTFTGPGANDWVIVPEPTCPGNGSSVVVLPSGSSCIFDVFFFPGALGNRPAQVTIQGSTDSGVSVSLSGTGGIGYYQTDTRGDVAPAGDAAWYGDTGGLALNHPVVGMAATGDDGGYWLAASDGGLFAFGDATFHGSTGGMRLNQPVLGMAATHDDGGYWLVASDGGIFAFGDAGFHGSTGAIHLNQPVVGMASTPDDGGYWLVASDGGIFAFGDAGFYGSTGAIRLNQPVVGMAPTPDGRGYWLVAADGGIFSFGDAPFYGSTGAIHLNQPITGMAAMPDGGGYWFTAADGGLFAFGDAPFYGSSVGLGLSRVVGMATDGAPTLQAELDIPAVRQAHLSGSGLSSGSGGSFRQLRHFAGP